MTAYQFTVVIEPDEDTFHAYVPYLPGCHTFGTTIDEARANIAEAISLHIEHAGRRRADACRARALGDYAPDRGRMSPKKLPS